MDNLVDLMAETEMSEVEIINAYFDRNHEHRVSLAGPLAAGEHALAVGSHADQPCPPAGAAYLSAAFASVTHKCVDDLPEFSYIGALTATSPRNYFIHVNAHGGQTVHQVGSGRFWSSDYRAHDPTTIGFTFNCCNTCDYLVTDNLGATVAFNPESATLIVCGFSKTKPKVDSEPFYDVVGVGGSFGESFLAVARRSVDGICMILLGDGTLKPDPHLWDDGDPFSHNWSVGLNWEDDTLPSSTDHIRISDDTVQVDVGSRTVPAQVWSLRLDGGAGLDFADGLTQADGYGLLVSSALFARSYEDNFITMGPRTSLTTGALRNVLVEMEGAENEPSSLLVNGAFESGALAVNEYCLAQVGSLKDCSVTVATGGDLSAGVVSGCEVVLGENTDVEVGVCLGSSLELAAGALLNGDSLTNCGCEVGPGATVAVTGTVTVGDLAEAPAWVINEGSVTGAAMNGLWGLWEVSGGSLTTGQLKATEVRAFRLELREGAYAAVEQLPVPWSSQVPAVPFCDPAEGEMAAHELVYGDGANVFSGGVPDDDKVDQMYLGRQTRVLPAIGARDPQLTLDINCELHIASDFEDPLVRDSWNTLGVDLKAEPIWDGVQDIELISPDLRASLSGNPPNFVDVPCMGAFRNLSIEECAGTAPEPARVVNQYPNRPGGGPEAGWFVDVMVGSGRTLDFVAGAGVIYCSGERSIDGTVRYWRGGSPMIVTEESTPSLNELIILAVATLYGDWNGDCVISNIELAQLQAAIAGGSSTYDPLMDGNCDGVLSNVELAKFLGNMTVQPPCGGRDGGGGRGEGEGDDWAAEEDGGAEEEDGAGERSGGEDGVDVAELAAWIVAELSPEELAVFVADLAVAVEEFAGTPAGADMAALLAEFE